MPGKDYTAEDVITEVLRTQDAVVNLHGEIPSVETMEQAVSRGVVAGIKALSKDDEFIDQFWKSGYEHLTSRVGEGASKWVGKKVMLWFGGVLVAVGLYLAGKAGVFK